MDTTNPAKIPNKAFFLKTRRNPIEVRVEVEPTITISNIPGIKKSVKGVFLSRLKERLLFSNPVLKRIPPRIEVSAIKQEIIVERISITTLPNIGSFVVKVKLYYS